jgi:hypothetical protein
VGFPLDVLMVHSLALVVATDGELVTCSGFPLGEAIFFGSLEFIINRFADLSLSPKGSKSCAAFMGTTCGGSPSL